MCLVSQKVDYDDNDDNNIMYVFKTADKKKFWLYYKSVLRLSTRKYSTLGFKLNCVPLLAAPVW
jgi:hypothetical protein